MVNPNFFYLVLYFNSEKPVIILVGYLRTHIKMSFETGVDIQPVTARPHASSLKIAQLMLSACTQYARTHAYVGFFQAGLSHNRVRTRVRFRCDLRYESWSLKLQSVGYLMAKCV